MIDKTAVRLMQSFDRSFINQHGEFIAHKKSNTYFNLANCTNESEVKCNVLEWLSRAAYKTQVYGTDKKNNEFHAFMLAGINRFLETAFTPEEMGDIYTKLGNGCNRNLTLKFIDSGYDMAVLTGKKGDK